jgi:hypothetical protein
VPAEKDAGEDADMKSKSGGSNEPMFSDQASIES